MPILVDIVTPERRLLSQEVDMVTLPGIDGQMGILRGHAPLISTLDIGEIILRKGNDVQYIAVGGGVVEVRPDKVTILAESAESAEEINVQSAEAARERARASIEGGGASRYNPEALAALRRSNLRLKVAQKRRHRGAPHFAGDGQG
ncbi:MAG: F0F1 ATP synthase subunit epsilon [Chloroflexota bacterium]|nr:F0F1 ATP synthase subunit epsilon [Chloroflexota bacterium]